MWSQLKCKEYIKHALDKVRNNSSSSFVPFRERSFLTTSWLLKELLILKKLTEKEYTTELLELLNLHTPEELTLMLETSNPDIPDLISGIFERNSIVITTNMRIAAEEVFYKEVHDYSLNHTVAFLDEYELTGLDFLVYLYGIDAKFNIGYPSRNLFEIVFKAFRRALGLPDPENLEDHEFCGLVATENWSCLVAVVSSADALKGDTFIQIHSYFLEEGQHGMIPVICFCPPIAQVANTLANSGNNIFYVWGLSGIVFFNLLSAFVSQFGEELVRRKFPAFFDNSSNRKGAYQVRFGFANLKSELQTEAASDSQNRLIKLAIIIRTKGIDKAAIAQDTSGGFLPSCLISYKEEFSTSQITTFFENKGINIKKIDFFANLEDDDSSENTFETFDLLCAYAEASPSKRLPANLPNFGHVNWLTIADAEGAITSDADFEALQRADDLTSNYLT